MTSVTSRTLAQFHAALVSELHRHRDGDLDSPFTVAEIYQHLVPYRTHRDTIGVEINGDYEDALLRLLAGEGGYLRLESDVVRQELHDELKRSNPNTGLFREFAALEVRVNPASLASVPSTPAAAAAAPAPASPPALELELPGDSDARSISEPVVASGGRENERVAGSTRKPAAPAPAERSTPPAPSPGKAAAATPTPSSTGPSGGKGDEDAPTHCPDCSKTLPIRDSLRFCPFCGVNVRVAPCGECGEELERSWSFCVACGAAA